MPRIVLILAMSSAAGVFVASCAVVALSAARIRYSYTFWTCKGEWEMSLHDNRLWLDNDPQVYFDSEPQRRYKQELNKIAQRLIKAQDAKRISRGDTEAAEADREIEHAYAEIDSHTRRLPVWFGKAGFWPTAAPVRHSCSILFAAMASVVSGFYLVVPVVRRRSDRKRKGFDVIPDCVPKKGQK